MTQKSEKNQKKIRKWIITMIHGLLIPLIIAIVVNNTTDLYGVDGMILGALYYLFPLFIYEMTDEEIETIPGIFILGFIYMYGLIIVYLTQGGSYVL